MTFISSLDPKNDTTELIGNTPILKINSLSELSGCDIYIKCEHMNPGGSIKDRAALQMVLDAIDSGKLKKGMTIVEGTAGNTGIGLAVVAKSLGYNLLAVMPNNQTVEKMRMIELHGGNLKLVNPVPFKNENHFYHTARKLSEENPDQFWWANQFENLSNFKAHYSRTGPEIAEQMNSKLDYFIAASGTGGTIGGNSVYLKEKIPSIQTILVDPEGSGLFSYFHTGEFKSQGSSITEGIGIMRLVANFAKAHIDDAITISDQDIVTIAQFVRNEEGFILGSSSALNVAGAFKTALQFGPKKKILTFNCDLGERSFSKLYNEDYLSERHLSSHSQNIDQLIRKYKST